MTLTDLHELMLDDPPIVACSDRKFGVLLLYPTDSDLAGVQVPGEEGYRFIHHERLHRVNGKALVEGDRGETWLECLLSGGEIPRTPCSNDVCATCPVAPCAPAILGARAELATEPTAEGWSLTKFVHRLKPGVAIAALLAVVTSPLTLKAAIAKSAPEHVAQQVKTLRFPAQRDINCVERGGWKNLVSAAACASILMLARAGAMLGWSSVFLA